MGRALIAFYDDQMTHHAAALTYYALLSMFPTVLLGISLLGLLGQFPETYNSMLSYVAAVAPGRTVDAVDEALRSTLSDESAAAGALVVAVATTLYATTGALEAARRALNVVFETRNGRSFLRRKLTDIGSTVLLMSLGLVTLILMFVGGDLADDVFGLFGLGTTASALWNLVRWPAALVVAMLVFAHVYYMTPDVRQRGLRGVTPGAAVGVSVWLLASAGFSFYLSRFGEVNAVYGSFAAVIILIVWLWLTNVALLFGAELNAAIERQRQLGEGVADGRALALPERG